MMDLPKNITDISEGRRKELEKEIYGHGIADKTDAEIEHLLLEAQLNTEIISSEDLLKKVFPDPNWVIKGLLPEGLAILAGPPKTGKSWFVLSLAYAVSVGGIALSKYAVEQGKVLYLAMEDTERRLQSRSKMIDGFPTDQLFFTTRFERGTEGIVGLRRWLEKHSDTRLVIIDTLSKYLPDIDINSYSESYKEASAIKRIADDFGICILCLHHTRKGRADDWLDTFTGSNAFTGTADTNIRLQRGRGEADGFLSLTGRDIDEQEIAMKFDIDIGWEYLGPAEEYKTGETRKDILELLKESDEPLTPKDIAAMLNTDYGYIRIVLMRMKKDGQIIARHRGQYTLTGKE